ncbi:MAG: hypothetical protein ABR499_01665 [Gemmatimonadaceae bacterium]
MIRDPELDDFRTDLERLGAVVAPHRDHLCVRLPLFASVRVRVDEQGRLDCEPMFGPLPRTRAVLFSTTVLTAAAGGLLYTTGSSPLALTVAFVAIMSAMGTAWRFVLTESCITRVQLLWAARMSNRRHTQAPSVLPPTLSPALRAGEVPPPDLKPAQFATAERKL